MVELVAVADESGIHDAAPICIVSGFVGSVTHWLKLEDAWRRVLAEYDVPSFHAWEFFRKDRGRRVGPYRGWDDYRAAAFLTKLLDLIDERRLYPIGGAVEVAAFRALSQNERRFLTGGNLNGAGKWLSTGAPNKPYYLAFQHLMVEAIKRADAGKVVHFLFDGQRMLQARAIQTYMETLKHGALVGVGAEKLGKIAFADAAAEPGIQAADLHTHAWYSYFTRTDLDDDRRFAMDRLTRRRTGMRMYNAEGLDVILRSVPAELRAAWRAGASR